MSHAITIDDIWKLFQETNRLFQESKQENNRLFQESKQENDRLFQESKQENDRLFQESKQENDRLFQESKLEFQDSKREFADSKREWERRSLKADQEFAEIRHALRESGAETDRRFRETERAIKEVSRQIGQLGGRWGEFVEGLIAPACETMFLDRGIPVHQVHQRVKAKYPGNRHMEIDILVVNTDTVVPVEVKSRLRVEDVREHVTRLAEFKSFFSQYANMQVMGAVAGIVMDENVDRFAMNEGLFVIVQSGETVKLANEEKFLPKVW